MCSVEELEKIYQTVQDTQKQQQSRSETEKIQQLLVDTLALAGTHNTVYVLVQKIQNKKLSPTQVNTNILIINQNLFINNFLGRSSS